MKITDINQLRELYGFPSGRAKDKALIKLEKHSINFIQKSPFLILSTANHDGKTDASPRGGTSGFVHVLNKDTIIIPDAKGNNRLDSISNIILTGQVGILFLIPGVDETLRVNGKAFICNDESYLSLFALANNPPKTCMVITVKEVFLHCAKAFMRSKLWKVESRIDRNEIPTIGEMLKDQLKSTEPLESQEDMIKRYKKEL
jgi:PPOX class probable FMN-dependent enzyme